MLSFRKVRVTIPGNGEAMEEITKRFEIVRLAVQLGDTRTIEVQCDALRSLSLNEELDEIIDLLESRNYRQALYEMKHYSEKVKDEFFGERKASRSSGRRRGDAERMGPGLFDPESSQSAPAQEEHVLDVEDLLRLSREYRKPSVKEYSPPPSFDLESEEVEAERRASEPMEHTEPQPELKGGLDQRVAEEEGTELAHSGEHEVEQGSGTASETEPEEVQPHEEEPEEREEEEASVEKESHAVAPVKPETGEEESGASRQYAPIPYIGQKFRNMIHQFPPVEGAEGIPAEVEAMQKKIAREGYSESEIETFLETYRRYKEEGRKGEAALVLLLAAATESQFAQFLLARELFKGEVIEEDHAEAFTQINTLADQNFPEAICDLAQFYEHGIGIGKDRQLALLLYEEAAEMGVARAARHYQRLKNSRGLKGLLGKVKLPDLPLKLPKKS
jgi:hypothetical protein